MSGEANATKAGLEGIVAASSTVSYIDGNIGKLVYCGYNIHELAEHSTFEEVIYLLWNSKLPTQSELDELKAQFVANGLTTVGPIIDTPFGRAFHVKDLDGYKLTFLNAK